MSYRVDREEKEAAERIVEDELAFPDLAFPSNQDVVFPGLTKLEYFAGAVLQGMAANPDISLALNPGKNITKIAVARARDLIEALHEVEGA